MSDNKKDIYVTFSELRRTVNQILTIVSEKSGVGMDEISLKTTVNNDLGVNGDDWDPMLISLTDDAKINFEGFDFYSYFLDEGQIVHHGLYYLMFTPFVLIAYLIEMKSVNITFKKYLKQKMGDDKLDLTIADLVTSKLEGKFTPRNKRKIYCT